MSKTKLVKRSVNQIEIAQRVDDGFINATAMCSAYGKKIVSWLRTQDTLELFVALAEDLGMDCKDADLHLLDVPRLSARKYAAIFPGLIRSKPGAPDNGGGTWLHPDLAIQLAQWCNKRFAIQVSRWIREWMQTYRVPLNPNEIKRVESRDYLKDQARSQLVNQIKVYLVTIKRYVEGYREGYFKAVHDAINVAITTETSAQMKTRISKQIGQEVKSGALIRDYFPTEYLHHYIAMCNVVANLIRLGHEPLSAVSMAVGLALPSSYAPKPINAFEVPVKALRAKQALSFKGLTA